VLLNACTPVAHVKYAADGVRKAARETGRAPVSVDIACMLVMRQTDEPERFRPDLESRIGSLLEEPRVGGILRDIAGRRAGSVRQSSSRCCCPGWKTFRR
jgi:hypothetical protein